MDREQGKPSVLGLDLPEIEGRSPYTPPTSHLVKTGANPWGTRAGRRASKTMLATAIRKAVDAWRSAGYPGASDCIQRRCFGGIVELDPVGLRRCLNHGPLIDAIATLIARRIGELTATPQTIRLVDGDIRVSETRPFIWRRKWVECDKTVFNVVACYNELETRFAEFLDRCLDIDRFAALAEWFTTFNVQYLSAGGAVRLYYPDYRSLLARLPAAVLRACRLACLRRAGS